MNLRAQYTQKKKAETGIPLPPWITTYSDLISQLLVFFIMFFSLSKAGRILELQESLKEFQEKVEMGFLVKEGEKPGEVVLRLEAEVLFDSGKAVLKESARPALDNVYEIILDDINRKGPATIRVEGHTDTQPIHTERFPSNWELSASRAINVVRYYLAKGLFTPDNMQAVGFGEFKPIAPNDTFKNMQKNRRVEIKIIRSNIDHTVIEFPTLTEEGIRTIDTLGQELIIPHLDKKFEEFFEEIDSPE